MSRLTYSSQAVQTLRVQTSPQTPTFSRAYSEKEIVRWKANITPEQDVKTPATDDSKSPKSNFRVSTIDKTKLYREQATFGTPKPLASISPRRRRRDGKFVLTRSPQKHLTRAASSPSITSTNGRPPARLAHTLNHHALINVVLRVCDDFTPPHEVVAYEARRFCIVRADAHREDIIKSLRIQLNIRRIRDVTTLCPIRGEIPFQQEQLIDSSTLVVYCQLEDMEEAAWYFVRNSIMHKENQEAAEQAEDGEAGTNHVQRVGDVKQNNQGVEHQSNQVNQVNHHEQKVSDSPTTNKANANAQPDQSAQYQYQTPTVHGSNGRTGDGQSSVEKEVKPTAADEEEEEEEEIVLILKGPGYEQTVKIPGMRKNSPNSRSPVSSQQALSPRTPHHSTVDREVQTIQQQQQKQQRQQQSLESEELLQSINTRRRSSTIEYDPRAYRKYSSSLDLFRLAALDPCQADEMYEYKGVWHTRSPTPPTIPRPPPTLPSQSHQRLRPCTSAINFTVDTPPVKPIAPRHSPTSPTSSHGVMYTCSLDLDELIDD